jgi:1,4-dihydroxy-2-naphthoate octaprenyltransferase
MVLGGWITQTGSPAWEPVWASLPLGFLILNVLWINQFPDAAADAAVGKRHWVVRLGRRRATLLYGLFFLGAYLSLVVALLLGTLPVWTLLALLPAPLAWRAYRVAHRHYDEPPQLAPANALTVQLHLLTGLFLVVGYLIQGLLW